MKRKFINTKFITMSLACIMLGGVLTGCTNSTAAEGQAESVEQNEERAELPNNILDTLDMDIEPTPTNYRALAEDLANMYQQNPKDTTVALAYAEKLTQLSYPEESDEVLASIPASEDEPQAIYIAANNKYLLGDYEQAEKLYQKLLDGYPEYKERAEFGIEFVYYQTNQYAKAKSLSGESASASGIGEMMRNFGDREPYKVSWDDKKETVVPFVVTEPLPLVELEINGEKKYFLIDTGAGDTYLNESVANELGLEATATQTSPYAGGIEVTTTFGVLDSMKLNGVMLENVTVNIANMDHFAGLAGEEYEISGVIGTGVFKQFLVTMDYINGELTLKPRGEHLQADPGAFEAEFIMDDTHFMLCKAKVNSKEINVFVDSGLAAEESLLLSDGAMEYIGISQTERPKTDDESGGLGGADFAMGTFVVDTYEMGNIPVAHDMKGISGILPGSGYEVESEFFLDGIISHNYLKSYKWTIDYDLMKMTFSK